MLTDADKGRQRLAWIGNYEALNKVSSSSRPVAARHSYIHLLFTLNRNVLRFIYLHQSRRTRAGLNGDTFIMDDVL